LKENGESSIYNPESLPLVTAHAWGSCTHSSCCINSELLQQSRDHADPIHFERVKGERSKTRKISI